MDLLETKASDAAREIAEQQENYMRAILNATDWDETPIVDIVWAQRDIIKTSEPGDPDRYAVKGPKATVRRYESPAPPVAESAVDGERCEVQRVTRPLYEKLRREHPDSF